MKLLNALLRPFHLEVIQTTAPGEKPVPACYGRAHSASDPLCTGGDGLGRCDYYKACEARTKTTFFVEVLSAER